MIRVITQLLERNHAYIAEGHVLFDVSSFKNYGVLSGREGKQQLAGVRIEVASYKRNSEDFVLWKSVPIEEMGWDSPWGYGRPGWHIECSAMVEDHLGLPIDIHGGGADLKFPHHENEIAQSCCAHGHEDIRKFARYWVHNGFVTVNGAKMAKSSDNFVTVQDLKVRGISGQAIRYALLTAHYRQPLDWSDTLLRASLKTVNKFNVLLRETESIAAEAVQSRPLMEGLFDNLNTPKALASLSKVYREANNERTPKNVSKFRDAMQILGLREMQ